MASIARVGKTKFVANLEWRAVEKGNDVDRRVAAILREEKAGYGVFYDVPSLSGAPVRVVGVIAEKDFEPNLKGVPSLAATVAEKIRDGYIITPLNSVGDSARWWFCGFNGGAVRPGTDLVAREDTVIAALREQLETVGDAPIYVPVAARGHVMSLGRTLREVDLDDLVGEVASEHKVVRLKKEGAAVILALLFGLGALAGAGYMAYTLFFEDEQLLEEELSAEEMAARAREAFVLARGLQIDQVLTTSTNVWVYDAKSYVFGLPRRSSGYEMEKIVCKPDGLCTVKYVATARPSLKGFRGEFEWRATGPIVFPMDGTSAEFSVRYSGIDATKKSRSVEFYEAVPEHATFVEELVLRMQRLKNSWPNDWSRNLSQVQSLAIAATNPFGTEYFTGTINVTMDELWLFEPVMSALASQYVSVQKLEVLNRPYPSLKFDASYVIAKYPAKK